MQYNCIQVNLNHPYSRLMSSVEQIRVHNFRTFSIVKRMSKLWMANECCYLHSQNYIHYILYRCG